MRLVSDLNALQQFHRCGFGLTRGGLANPLRRYRAILKDRHMRKEVEVLKTHAHLGSYFIDVLEVSGQLDPINDDIAFFDAPPAG